MVIPFGGEAGLLIVYSMVGTTKARRSRHSTQGPPQSVGYGVRRCRVYLLSFPYSARGRSSSSVEVEEERRSSDRPSDSFVDDVNRHFIFHVLPPRSNGRLLWCSHKSTIDSYSRRVNGPRGMSVK